MAVKDRLEKAVAQLTRALDQIATLPATPALRREKIMQEHFYADSRNFYANGGNFKLLSSPAPLRFKDARKGIFATHQNLVVLIRCRRD